jgi:hypothetical protein
MGFFSWKTADTGESIGNTHSLMSHDDHHGPVYLLSPEGEHIKERGYDGYGVFKGVNAYSWLAIYNLKDESSKIILKGLGLSDSDVDVANAVMSRLTGKPFDATLLNKHATESDINEIGNKMASIAIRDFVSIQRFDPDTGERVINGVGDIPFRHDEPIAKYEGKSLNQLNSIGFFDSKWPEIKFPLKFSFNAEAIYDELGASEDCPDQGYFYDDDDNVSPR